MIDLVEVVIIPGVGNMRPAHHLLLTELLVCGQRDCAGRLVSVLPSVDTDKSEIPLTNLLETPTAEIPLR